MKAEDNKKDYTDKQKLMQFREWLISETERFQEKAKALDASREGEHYNMGHAAAFIQARAELEELFNYWDEK